MSCRPGNILNHNVDTGILGFKPCNKLTYPVAFGSESPEVQRDDFFAPTIATGYAHQHKDTAKEQACDQGSWIELPHDAKTFIVSAAICPFWTQTR